MVWRKPPFTDNEQRNWDLLGDAAEGGGSGGGGLLVLDYSDFTGTYNSILEADFTLLKRVNNGNVHIYFLTDLQGEEGSDYLAIFSDMNNAVLSYISDSPDGIMTLFS